MKKFALILAILLAFSLMGCTAQTTPATEPTEESDVIWGKIKAAVNERNSSEYHHLTLHLTNEDIHEIELEKTPTVSEYWFWGETCYVEVYSNGEWKPYNLDHEGYSYLSEGENQWRVIGNNSDGFDVTIDLPGGKSSLADWIEIDGQLEAVLKTEDRSVTLRLDADGKLLWYSMSSEGYAIDGEGQRIPTILHWILVYNDTAEQQIKQTVETVVANMEILEHNAEP